MQVADYHAVDYGGDLAATWRAIEAHHARLRANPRKPTSLRIVPLYAW